LVLSVGGGLGSVYGGRWFVEIRRNWGGRGWEMGVLKGKGRRVLE